jgi:hypothetical protein
MYGAFCSAPGRESDEQPGAVACTVVYSALGQHPQRAGRFPRDMAVEPEEGSEGFLAEAPRFVMREI